MFETNEHFIRALSGITYYISGGLILGNLVNFVTVLDTHAGAKGSILGVLTFATNFYFQRKRVKVK